MITYKDAGVDIEKGNTFAKRIQLISRTTLDQKVLPSGGGFSGLFDVSFLKDYEHPVLVSSTDGVGTKVEIARQLKKLDTIGIDLVAMVVNDIAVCGAKPLFFLDYYATGELHLAWSESIIEGIIVGCEIAKCCLIGGETAEMPGIYDDGKFDLAGFGVGVVEKSEILPKKEIMVSGDVLLGIPSSGLHSNGFSLIRKIIREHNLPLCEEMLTPTQIYVHECWRTRHIVKGFAHITGGGWVDNIPRILPDHLKPEFIHWELPYPFNSLQEKYNVSRDEMFKTFNCGVGMVAVVDSRKECLEEFQSLVPKAKIIGTLVEKTKHEETTSSSSGV